MLESRLANCLDLYAAVWQQGKAFKRQTITRARPRAPPSVAVSGVKRLLSASDKSVAEKPAVPPKVDKIIADSNAEEPAPVTEKEKTAVKPVGVVKATPRKVPADTQRSINNVIKLDEVRLAC